MHRLYTNTEGRTEDSKNHESSDRPFIFACSRLHTYRFEHRLVSTIMLKLRTCDCACAEQGLHEDSEFSERLFIHVYKQTSSKIETIGPKSFGVLYQSKIVHKTIDGQLMPCSRHISRQMRLKIRSKELNTKTNIWNFSNE